MNQFYNSDPLKGFAAFHDDQYRYRLIDNKAIIDGPPPFNYGECEDTGLLFKQLQTYSRRVSEPRCDGLNSRQIIALLCLAMRRDLDTVAAKAKVLEYQLFNESDDNFNETIDTLAQIAYKQSVSLSFHLQIIEFEMNRLRREQGDS